MNSGSKCNVYGDFDWDNKEYQEKLNQYGTNSAKFVCNEISSSILLKLLGKDAKI